MQEGANIANTLHDVLIDIKKNNFADLEGKQFYVSNDEHDEANNYRDALVNDLFDEAYKTNERLLCPDFAEEMYKILSSDKQMQLELLEFMKLQVQDEKSVFISSPNMSFKEVLKQRDPQLRQAGLFI